MPPAALTSNCGGGDGSLTSANHISPCSAHKGDGRTSVDSGVMRVGGGGGGGGREGKKTKKKTAPCCRVLRSLTTGR